MQQKSKIVQPKVSKEKITNKEENITKNSKVKKDNKSSLNPPTFKTTLDEKKEKKIKKSENEVLNEDIKTNKKTVKSTKVSSDNSNVKVTEKTNTKIENMSMDLSNDELSAQQLEMLFKEAKKVAERAYAPYSNFKVGVVLLIDDGNDKSSQFAAYTGCNIENASYSLTCCAERVAIFKAISDGNKKFKAMILYSTSDKPVSPCGACRQVLSEFADLDMKIYSIGNFNDNNISKTTYVVYTLKELLPHSFSSNDFIKK